MTRSNNGESVLPGNDNENWHLDKKVPITLIFVLLTQAAAGLWFISDIKKDVELLKQDTAALHLRDTQNSDSLRDAMRLMQEQFRLLDAKLDRLIERGQK
jgi:hypothetical protein